MQISTAIKNKYHHLLLQLVVVFCCIAIVQQTQAQCSFERLEPEIKSAGIARNKIVELKNGNVAYFNGAAYVHALVNDSNTHNGMMTLTDACGTVLNRTILSYDPGNDRFFDAIETTDGNILALLRTEGYFSNTALMKVNPYTGYVYWKKHYPSDRPSSSDGISYNPYHNSYLVAGRGEFGGPNDTYKAYLLEVDTGGKVLHQLYFPPYLGGTVTDKFNTYFFKAVAIDSMRTMVLGVYDGIGDSDTNCFVHIYDSGFNLLKQTFPLKGKYISDGFNSGERIGVTDIDKVHQLLLYAQNVDSIMGRGHLVAVIDSTGTMVKHKLMKESSTIHLGYEKPYATATKDGGYMVPNGYIKLDSNLQVVSTAYAKNYKDIDFNYAIQLSDSSFTGIAYAFAYNSELQDYVNALYTHRTNTKGWYTGVAQVAEATSKNIEVYPNPTSGLITIKTAMQIGNRVTVVNALGKQVFSGELVWNSELDLSHLTNGVYWLTMHLTNGQLVTTKVVLNK